MVPAATTIMATASAGASGARAQDATTIDHLMAAAVQKCRSLARNQIRDGVRAVGAPR
jgi:hypothetical protein